MKAMTFGDNYTPYTAFEAQGRRTAITTCKICGAAVLLDEAHATVIHERWHYEHRGAEEVEGLRKELEVTHETWATEAMGFEDTIKTLTEAVRFVLFKHDHAYDPHGSECWICAKLRGPLAAAERRA
jgi:hypothetical protein